MGGYHMYIYIYISISFILLQDAPLLAPDVRGQAWKAFLGAIKPMTIPTFNYRNHLFGRLLTISTYSALK